MSDALVDAMRRAGWVAWSRQPATAPTYWYHSIWRTQVGTHVHEVVEPTRHPEWTARQYRQARRAWRRYQQRRFAPADGG